MGRLERPIVRCVDADFPPLVAVTVRVSATSAVTSPVESTMATVVRLLAQLTGRPESTAPFASFTTAVSRRVCRTGSVSGAGAIVVDATGVSTGSGCGGGDSVVLESPAHAPRHASSAQSRLTDPPVRLTPMNLA